MPSPSDTKVSKLKERYINMGFKFKKVLRTLFVGIVFSVPPILSIAFVFLSIVMLLKISSYNGWLSAICIIDTELFLAIAIFLFLEFGKLIIRLLKKKDKVSGGNDGI